MARSLDPARVRAENRVQRFLDAALELMNDGDRRDFTVQQVVERSGQSLRSFYQYFGGKHELLLALFEELVRSSAEHLREHVDASDDALDRLHRFVVEYHRMCRPARRGKGKKAPAPAVVMEFAQQLLTEHPAEAARAHAPMVSLFQELLGAAASAGAIRSDLPLDRVAGTVLQAIMFNAFAMTIAGPSASRSDGDPGEQFWDVVFNGIGAAGGGRAGR